MYEITIDQMKYKKKQIVVEAVQFNKKNEPFIKDWLARIDPLDKWQTSYEEKDNCFYLNIVQHNGQIVASETDYIIHDLDGELHVCRQGLFDLMYEPYSLYIDGSVKNKLNLSDKNE